MAPRPGVVPSQPVLTGSLEFASITRIHCARAEFPVPAAFHPSNTQVVDQWGKVFNAVCGDASAGKTWLRRCFQFRVRKPMSGIMCGRWVSAVNLQQQAQQRRALTGAAAPLWEDALAYLQQLPVPDGVQVPAFTIVPPPASPCERMAFPIFRHHDATQVTGGQGSGSKQIE